MTPPVPRSDEERGLTILFVALLLVVMLLFAAFAIDIGALYNHRREDQNAADSGALAAAQDLDGVTATMVATAKDYVEDTVGETFTASQWNSCGADGGSLANLAPGSNCISYTVDQVRVRVPDQQYETFFASVAGIDSFRHSAFAIAALVPDGFGGVLPFGVTGTSADGGFGCLQSNSNGQASQVCGSVSGNFRYLDFGQFGSSTLGTTNNCGNGTQEDRLRDHMGMGVDHSLSIFGEVYAGEVIDTVACVPPQQPSPNAVYTRTGNQSADATIGLFDGTSANFSDGQPARLRREDSRLTGEPSRISVLGVSNLDNVPLWFFIGADDGRNIPDSCRREEFVDGSGNFTINNTPPAVRNFLSSRTQGDQSIAMLQRCFDHYRGQPWTGFPVGDIGTPEPPSGCSGTCNAPIFNRNTSVEDPEMYDIQFTSRFGYIPQLNSFGDGNSVSRITAFKAIFIQRLYIEQSSGGVTWDPGVNAPPSSGSYQRLGETSMFIFPIGSLPNGLADENAPFEIGLNRFVRLVR